MNLRKNFRREVLDNGVTLLFEKRVFPIVSMSITSKIGAMYESEKERGLAHFVEHLLFQGTKSKSKEEINLEVDEAGGEFNAQTSDVDVDISIKCPDDFAEKSIEILIDIVKNALFNEEDIEKERKIIFEEIDSDKDNPEEYCNDKLASTIYSGSISVPVFGTKENVKRFKRKDLVKKYHELFLPENLIVTVVGNYSFEKLKNKINLSFEKGKRKEKDFPKIVKKISKKIECRKGLDQARLVFCYYSIPSSKKNYRINDVLYTILNNGDSSRLYKKLRDEKGVSYDLIGNFVFTKFYSYGFLNIGCSKIKIKKIEEMIVEEFLNIANNLGEKEFKSAKKKLLGWEKIGQESCEDVNEGLAFSELTDKNAEIFYDYSKIIHKVGIEDVKKLARKVADGNYGTFTLTPK